MGLLLVFYAEFLTRDGAAETHCQAIGISIAIYSLFVARINHCP